MKPKISYESSEVKCKKCGKVNNILHKFCSECGAPLLMLVEEIKNNTRPITKELLMDASESLYNNIINDDKIKKKYYKSISEKALLNRVDTLHPKGLITEMMAAVDKRYAREAEFKTLLRSYSMSSTLQGYVVRLCEELLSGEYLKIKKLSKEQIEKYIRDYLEIVKDISEFQYTFQEIMSTPEKLLDCFAYYLALDENRYNQYSIADKETVTIIMGFIINDIFKPIFTDYEDFLGKPLDNKKELLENVVEDVIWGYCLKLSESLLAV